MCTYGGAQSVRDRHVPSVYIKGGPSTGTGGGPKVLR